SSLPKATPKRPIRQDETIHEERRDDGGYPAKAELLAVEQRKAHHEAPNGHASRRARSIAHAHGSEQSEGGEACASEVRPTEGAHVLVPEDGSSGRLHEKDVGAERMDPEILARELPAHGQEHGQADEIDDGVSDAHMFERHPPWSQRREHQVV